MENAYLDIEQSDLDEIANKLRDNHSVAVVLSVFEKINKGRTLRICERGVVKLETKSCDDLSSYILSKMQPVPEDSPLLKMFKPVQQAPSASKNEGKGKI